MNISYCIFRDSLLRCSLWFISITTKWTVDCFPRLAVCLVFSDTMEAGFQERGSWVRASSNHPQTTFISNCEVHNSAVPSRSQCCTVHLVSEKFPSSPKDTLHQASAHSPLPLCLGPGNLSVCFLSPGTSDTVGHSSAVHMFYRKVGPTCMSVKCGEPVKGTSLSCKDEEVPIHTAEQRDP